jgi:DNA-binding transcriptional MerR regulator
MEKSPDAFRTISEVADWLDVPAHVLRFWESRFSQVRPVKRAGGRRYYRPADMALLDGIRKLLHDDGMSIRGVQSLLREKGTKAVAALARPLDEPRLSREDGEGAAAPSPEEEFTEALGRMPADTPESAPEPPAATFSHRSGEAKGTSVPEAPMAADVPVEDSAEDAARRVVPFSPTARPAPRASATADNAAPDADDQPGLPFDIVETAPKRSEATPRPGPFPIPDLPPDPADDDAAFVRPPRPLSRLAALEPETLRALHERLTTARRRLGATPRRSPPG